MAIRYGSVISRSGNSSLYIMKKRNCLSLYLSLAGLFISAFLYGQNENNLPHFLFPEFKEGVTLMKDGKSFISLLNYNTVDEMMVTKLNGTYRYATRLNEIDTIVIEKRKFIPVGKAFYEVLVTGPVSFLLQNKSLFTPKGSNVGYGAKSQSVGPTDYKRFELNSTDVVNIELPQNVEIKAASAYWVNQDNKMKRFTNENQFLKIFPEKAADLKKYIKAEKLNFKKREDVIKLAIYYHQL